MREKLIGFIGVIVRANNSEQSLPASIGNGDDLDRPNEYNHIDDAYQRQSYEKANYDNSEVSNTEPRE